MQVLSALITVISAQPAAVNETAPVVMTASALQQACRSKELFLECAGYIEGVADAIVQGQAFGKDVAQELRSAATARFPNNKELVMEVGRYLNWMEQQPDGPKQLQAMNGSIAVSIALKAFAEKNSTP